MVKVAPLTEYKKPFKSNHEYTVMANAILDEGLVADLSTVDPKILILPLTALNITKEFKKHQLRSNFAGFLLPVIYDGLGIDTSHSVYREAVELVIAGMLVENQNNPLPKNYLGCYHYPALQYEKGDLTELNEASKKIPNLDSFLTEAAHSTKLRSWFLLYFLGVNYSIPHLTKLREKVDPKRFLNEVDKELNGWLNRYLTPKGELKSKKKKDNYDNITQTRENLESLLATPEQVSEVLNNSPSS